LPKPGRKQTFPSGGGCSGIEGEGGGILRGFIAEKTNGASEKNAINRKRKDEVLKQTDVLDLVRTTKIVLFGQNEASKEKGPGSGRGCGGERKSSSLVNRAGFGGGPGQGQENSGVRRRRRNVREELKPARGGGGGGGGGGTEHDPSSFCGFRGGKEGGLGGKGFDT